VWEGSPHRELERNQCTGMLVLAVIWLCLDSLFSVMLGKWRLTYILYFCILHEADCNN
jgi:hypothetical protein